MYFTIKISEFESSERYRLDGLAVGDADTNTYLFSILNANHCACLHD